MGSITVPYFFPYFNYVPKPFWVYMMLKEESCNNMSSLSILSIFLTQKNTCFWRRMNREARECVWQPQPSWVLQEVSFQTLLSRQGTYPTYHRGSWWEWSNVNETTWDRPGNIIVLWIHRSRSPLHSCIACSIKGIAIAAANKLQLLTMFAKGHYSQAFYQGHKHSEDLVSGRWY